MYLHFLNIGRDFSDLVLVEESMRFEILNGGNKVTLIESFDGRASVISKGFKLEFPDLWEAKRHIAEQGWEINIFHLAGSPARRMS